MHIITTWQRISPQVIVKDFKQCCTSNAVDGTDDDDDTLGNGSEEQGNVKSVRETKALIVKVETVTLTGKGR